MSKHKCGCGAMAQWIYMPGYSGGGNSFSCDDCVMPEDDKLGCSCNWRVSLKQEGFPTDEPEGIENVDWKRVTNEDDTYNPIITLEDGYWQFVDERGRPYPCAEYDYSEDGFDTPTLYERVYYFLYDIKSSFKRKKNTLKKTFNKWWEKHICSEDPYHE